MEIKDCIKLKNETEAEINTLLRDFTLKTGLVVEIIDITTITDNRCFVRVDVTLPYQLKENNEY